MKRILLFLTLSLAQIHAKQTYFSYSEQEVASLRELSSKYCMSARELRRWDRIASQAIAECNLNYNEGMRVYTYLYVAQGEAAILSAEVKDSYVGSLDPISYAVLTLFLPNVRKPSFYREDLFSRTLAKMVYGKIAQRYESEDVSDFTRWTPWYASPPESFWPPPPPDRDSPIWQEQLREIRSAQCPMTRSKRRESLFWAAIQGPDGQNPGLRQWRIASNKYLFSHCSCLSCILHVRSVLNMGRYDATIVLFGAKDAYDIPRPGPCVCRLLPMPRSSSYPSGHATESAAAATLLSALLPENRAQWQRMAIRCEMSRIWGGVHHPLDVIAGRESGIRVAEKVLEEAVSSSDPDCYLICSGRLRGSGWWFGRCDEANSLCTIREEKRTNPAPLRRGMADKGGGNLGLWSSFGELVRGVTLIPDEHYR